MAEIAIIGIGNAMRGDDSAGLAVIDALQQKTPPHVLIAKSRADVGELLSYFETNRIVYLIDACIADQSADTWKRLDALQEKINFERPQTSTHGFSVAQAIDLAKILGKLPSKLIIYAIFASRYSIGDVRSAEVEKAIALVAQSILEEIAHA